MQIIRRLIVEERVNPLGLLSYNGAREQHRKRRPPSEESRQRQGGTLYCPPSSVLGPPCAYRHFYDRLQFLRGADGSRMESGGGLQVQISSSPILPNKMAKTKKISIIGSGNWGSTIAKIVGSNVTKFPDLFDSEVKMWVFEEIVNGSKLTEIINTQHENVKYLKGHKLPENVVAMADIAEAAVDADILIFVVPHQFLKVSCAPLVGKLKKEAIGISLVKGFALMPTGGIGLMSDIMRNMFDSMPMSVLMGANLAGEVADGSFCETTIGCQDQETGQTLKRLFETANFKVSVVEDVQTVEICGALKNVVACAAGFVDGLKYGDNTKAAVIRIGLMEIIKYCVEHHKQSNSDLKPKLSTFFESCGVADLITTCYGGRNRKVSEVFITSGKSFSELEKEMLDGQKLQGPETAAEVNHLIKAKGMEAQFPLFTSVHLICSGQIKPDKFLDLLRDHPVHKIPESHSHL